VDIEVVAAGVAPNQLRCDGEEGGEKNDQRACAVTQARLFPGLISEPCSALFHGSRRKVWVIWAATAGGVKGSARVVPVYQPFHWSRK